MKKIRPVSDLRNNFSEISKMVHETAEPVFLTKNGHGRYAVMDMHDYEKMQTTLELMNEIAKGRRSGEEQGWIDADEVESRLGIPPA